MSRPMRDARLARGVCIDCADAPHQPERVRCRDCGARNSRRTSAAAKRKKLARVLAAHATRRAEWREARRRSAA